MACPPHISGLHRCVTLRISVYLCMATGCLSVCPPPIINLVITSVTELTANSSKVLEGGAGGSSPPAAEQCAPQQRAACCRSTAEPPAGYHTQLCRPDRTCKYIFFSFFSRTARKNPDLFATDTQLIHMKIQVR